MCMNFLPLEFCPVSSRSSLDSPLQFSLSNLEIKRKQLGDMPTESQIKKQHKYIYHCPPGSYIYLCHIENPAITSWEKA